MKILIQEIDSLLMYKWVIELSPTEVGVEIEKNCESDGQFYSRPLDMGLLSLSTSPLFKGVSVCGICLSEGPYLIVKDRTNTIMDAKIIFGHAK